MHDADDATLIKFPGHHYRQTDDIEVILPKGPDDIGQPFGQRYAPVTNRYREGRFNGAAAAIGAMLALFALACVLGSALGR